MNTSFTPSNSVQGLLWGLHNFDGIEFDLRVSRDDHVFIHHDPVTTKGTVIKHALASELKQEGIPELKDLFTHEYFPKILQANKSLTPKSLWVEVKHECKRNGVKDEQPSTTAKLSKVILDEFSSYDFPKGMVRFIGFSWTTLQPFLDHDEYKVMPILPAVNECYRNPTLQVIMAAPKFFAHTLFYHASKAKKIGFHGLLFSKNYIKGTLSKRHPSYTKILQLRTDTFELGVDVASLDEEQEYQEIHRFTDNVLPFPRYSTNPKTHIIAHRGVGKQGINSPVSLDF